MIHPTTWTIENVALLPKYLRELEIPFYLVNDGRQLAPISKLGLSRFSLREVPRDELEISSQWLGSCLPPQLDELNLSVAKVAALAISTDCIRLCKLGEVVPLLRYLTMHILFNNNEPMGPLFASLPQKLRFLELTGLVSIFELNAISFLPRSLFEIIITFDERKMRHLSTVLTNEHFQGLPERLVDLTLDPPGNTLNADLVQYLPPTLSSFCIEYNNDIPGPESGSLQKLVQARIERTCCPRYDEQ